MEMKTGENRGKELNNICMNVSSTPERQWSTMIYYQRNSLLQRQKKKISIHYFTGQNQGLSRLKNIWLVIMTGNQLSVIFSPARDDWDDWDD